MKFGLITSAFIMGSAAAAIAVAPSALAATTITNPDGGANSTTTQRPGHVAIVVTPPEVSDARSYGESSTPAAIMAD